MTKGAKIQLALVGTWVILLYPTMVWWRESIPWLVFMSWYAIFVGHISAYIANRAKDKAEEES